MDLHSCSLPEAMATHYPGMRYTLSVSVIGTLQSRWLCYACYPLKLLAPWTIPYFGQPTARTTWRLHSPPGACLCCALQLICICTLQKTAWDCIADLSQGHEGRQNAFIDDNPLLVFCPHHPLSCSVTVTA